MTTNTVYVTTSDGGLDEPIVDGDVLVLTCDWANLDRVESAEELAESIGLTDGLPAGLIEAVADDMSGAGWPLAERPTPGPDRPWAYVTFVDQTFASDGATCSEDVTVVYHDWSLRYADLGIGIEQDDDFIDGLRREAEELGPKGRTAALAIIDDFAAQVEEHLLEQKPE